MFNPSRIYLLNPVGNPNSPDDRPVKIVFEGDPIQLKSESRIIPESERLAQTLKQMSNKKLLTAQQYRSVKGQVRKGYYSVVHAFLIKHNYYDYFLSLPTIENYEVGYIEMGVSVSSIRKLGIYTFEDKGESQ